MKNNYLNRKVFGVFIVFVCLSIAGVSITGCAPLKKKFTRRKKDGDRKDKFIPVLEPVDYEKQAYSSIQQYSKAYSLWMVWQKDYLRSLEDEESDKSQKYLIEKIIVELEEMKLFVVEERANSLQDIILSYRDVQSEYTKPARMRNIRTMQRAIERNGKKIRLNFSPNVLEESSYTGISNDTE